MRATDFRQLEDAMCCLLVEAVCPVCGRIMIATIPQARNILAFGCDQCGDIGNDLLLNIEEHMMSELNNINSISPQKADPSTEESNGY